MPRPSAYRAFSNSTDEPQRYFRRELLVELIKSCKFVEAQQLTEAFGHITADARRDDVSAEELTAQLREVVRVGSNTYSRLSQQDPHFLVYMTASAASRDAENEFNHVFVEAERTSAATYSNLYRHLCDLFGLRLRTGWTWTMFGSAVTTIQTGTYVFGNYASQPEPISRATGPDGEDQDWNMLGVLIEALIIQCSEPNPRMVVSAEPTRWTSS